MLAWRPYFRQACAGLAPSRISALAPDGRKNYLDRWAGKYVRLYGYKKSLFRIEYGCLAVT